MDFLKELKVFFYVINMNVMIKVVNVNVYILYGFFVYKRLLEVY